MNEGNDMGFILGFLLGFLAAIGLAGFMAFWVCTRSNRIALAKAVNGLAIAIATKQKPPEPPAPPAPVSNGDTKAEAMANIPKRSAKTPFFDRRQSDKNGQ
jgi:hypothetical protein